MSEYAVMGERHDGKVVTIKRGFRTVDEAEEDCKIKAAHWRRWWVQEISEPTTRVISRRGRMTTLKQMARMDAYFRKYARERVV